MYHAKRNTAGAAQFKCFRLMNAVFFLPDVPMAIANHDVHNDARASLGELMGHNKKTPTIGNPISCPRNYRVAQKP